MKFKADSGILSEKLALVQGISERRATLPILSHVLLQATSNRVNITATDLETTLKTSFEAEVEVEGSVALPSRKLFEIAKELPSGYVEIEEKNNHWVELSNPNSRFKIAGLPSEDFPEIKRVEPDGMFAFDSELMEDMISKTLYAASPDELRRNLSGIYFEQADGNSLRLVATDGHRLSKAEIESKEDFSLGHSILVPKKGVSELRKLIRLGDEVKLGATDTNLISEVGDVVLFIRLIDAEFPNYAQVIPNSTKVSFNVDREELQGALRRVSLMSSEKTKGIKLVIDSGVLELSSVSPEVGEAKETISIGFEGEAVEIGFNSRYLMDILECTDEELFEIGVTDELNPALIKPVGNENFIAVIMPMRV